MHRANYLSDKSNAILESLAPTSKDFQPPLISSLPPEIISHIFTCCLPCSPGLDIFSPFKYGDCGGSDLAQFIQFRVLGAVCSDWRRTAWSTPKLWDILSVELSWQSQSRMQSVFFKEWLERSGKLPLYLRIHYLEDPYPDADLTIRRLRPFFDILNSHISRVRVLDIRNPDPLISIIRCTSPEDTPALESLSLGLPTIDRSWQEQSRSLTFSLGTSSSKPNLKRFYAILFLLKNIDVFWNDLTFLSVGFISFADVLELLRQAPRLLDCSFSMIHDLDDQDSVLPGSKSSNLITLLYLQEFRVDTNPYSLWTHLTFPSLTHLSCSISSEIEHIRPFLVRSGCTLNSLKIYCANDEEAMEMLKLSPGVQNLNIDSAAITGLLFERLAKTSAVHCADLKLDKGTIGDSSDMSSTLPTMSFLPLLQKLEISGERHFSWSILPSTFPPFPPSPSLSPPTDLAIQPYRPFATLKLDIQPSDQDPEDGYYIDKPTLRLLLGLKEAGFRINITDVGEDGMRDVIEMSKYPKVDDAVSQIEGAEERG